MPIVISPTVMTADEEAQKEFMKEHMGNEENAFTDKKEIYPLKSIDSITHNNNINLDYVNYIEKIDDTLIGGISYTRATKLNILYKNNGKISLLDTTHNSLLFPLPETKTEKEDSVITNNFDLIYGNMAHESNELMLLIDTNNRLDLNLMKILGYTEDNIISFDDILNKEFKIVLNNELYEKIGNIFIMNNDFEAMYNNDNTITLKIVGILRGKEDNTFAKYSGTGLCYKEALMDLVIDKNNNSDIVKSLKDADYNVLTGEKIDLSTKEGNETKNTLLTYLGAESAPYLIQIYPKDFNSKDELTSYLDKYNDNIDKDEQIIYTDYAKSITTLSGSIMDAITIVLIAFSAISLIVSSIMIGIIMYISVLERTKEIGILRSLGARKKDITRVFNAETFIIGLFSGVLGIIIANILCIPANIIIENLTTLKNVAVLNPIHAAILIIISLILTLIGGYIPAKMASKRNPVESLRTE